MKETINALIALGNLGVTAALALITYFYLRATQDILKEAKRQSDLNAKQFVAAYRPYLSFAEADTKTGVHVLDATFTHVVFHLSNVGNVSVQFKVVTDEFGGELAPESTRVVLLHPHTESEIATKARPTRLEQPRVLNPRDGKLRIQYWALADKNDKFYLERKYVILVDPDGKRVVKVIDDGGN